MPLRYTREEIKEFLARLGFAELNEEELTEFIKDLRRLIKYEESKRRRRRLGHDSHSTVSTFNDTSSQSESQSLSSFLSKPGPMFESSRFEAESSNESPQASIQRSNMKLPSTFANLFVTEENPERKGSKGRDMNRYAEERNILEDTRDKGINDSKKNRPQRSDKKHSRTATIHDGNLEDDGIENEAQVVRGSKSQIRVERKKGQQDKVSRKESQVLFEFEDSEDENNEHDPRAKSAPARNKKDIRGAQSALRPKHSMNKEKKGLQNAREERERLKLENQQRELDLQLANLIGNDNRRSQKKEPSKLIHKGKGDPNQGENANEQRKERRNEKLQNIDDDQIKALFAKDTGREENKELINMITQALLSELSSDSSSSSDGSDTSSRLKKKKSFDIPSNVRNDPVLLYHFYKKIWDKQKIPGENSHLKLRWNVRGETMGKRPCHDNGKNVDYLTRNGIPLPMKIYQRPRYYSGLNQAKHVYYRCVPITIPANGC